MGIEGQSVIAGEGTWADMQTGRRGRMADGRSNRSIVSHIVTGNVEWNGLVIRHAHSSLQTTNE